jgi:tetratricopeptide (TPR) repeat protein
VADRSDSVLDLPGIGAGYRRLLARAGISTTVALRERSATAEDRKVLSWQTGISEALLDKWYRASFAQREARPAPEDEGLTERETEFISGPQRGAHAIGRAWGAPGLGRRVFDAIGEHRLFAIGTMGIAAVLLLAGFVAYVRGLSRRSDLPGAVALDSRASSPKAAAHDPRAVEANREGERLLSAGDLDSARERLEEAVRVDPSVPDAWLNLGRVLLRRKELDRAEACLIRAAELAPRAVPPLYCLAHVAMERREWARAAALCREALALDPAFRFSWFDLGILAHVGSGEVVLSAGERKPVIRALVEELQESEAAEAALVMAALAGLSGAGPPPDDAAGWLAWWEEQGRLAR